MKCYFLVIFFVSVIIVGCVLISIILNDVEKVY